MANRTCSTPRIATSRGEPGKVANELKYSLWANADQAVALIKELEEVSDALSDEKMHAIAAIILTSLVQGKSSDVSVSYTSV